MQYFTLDEFIKSETAERYDIDNTPDKDSTNNIMVLGDILDDIRADWTTYCEEKKLGKPSLIITSGFRCDRLNKLVKGSDRSAHLKGHAADIIPSNGEVQELFMFMQRWLFAHATEYDELIMEESKGTKWVHFAVKSYSGAHRHKVATLVK